MQKNCDCGCSLERIESTKKTRQVFDIAKPQFWVTEYVIHSKVCPGCGKVHETEFPEDITQPIQYGENMQTLMSLSIHQLIPLGRTGEAIRDITGQSVSEGKMVNMSRALCDKLEGACSRGYQEADHRCCCGAF